MATVYVVTSGSYLDYRIDAMFSTQEKAEQYIARRNQIASNGDEFAWSYDGNGFEEWELDEPDEAWLRGESDLWVVWFHHGAADVKSVEVDSYGDTTECVTFNKPMGNYLGGCRVTVFAENQERAVKVAMERRSMAIARGEDA